MSGFSRTTREKRRLMAHRLAMDKVHAITTLGAQGISERQIAKTLGISRKAVRRHLGRLVPKDTKAPTGSAKHETTGTAQPSRSACEGFRQLIIAKLEEGLTAQRIFQDLQEEHGFGGKYSSVRRFVHQSGQAANVKVDEDTRTGKVKYASAHDLRRSFGERWAPRVMPPILQELMRHENISTTMRYYVGQNAKRTAALLWDVHRGLGNQMGNQQTQQCESLDASLENVQA